LPVLKKNKKDGMRISVLINNLVSHTHPTVKAFRHQFVELEINGRLADLKTPDVKKYKNVSGPIKNLTVKAQEQKAKHTVIRLSERYDKESVINGVKNAFFYADKMEVIDIVFKNKKIARITREKYLSGDFVLILNDNWID
jgi:hypothetical protein